MADERSKVGYLDLKRLFEPDEVIQKFHADLQAANKVIEEEDLGAEEAAELSCGLDEEWQYMNHICVVSGKGYSLDGEEVVLEAERVASLGTGLVRATDGRIQIFHQLGILEEEDEVFESVFIDPSEGDMVHIKPVSKIEEEGIEALEYHYPDLKAELEEMFLNSEDVVEAVKKLSDFMFEHDPTKVEPDEFRIMVESYVNKLLEFDEKIPYSVAFKGTHFVLLPTSDGHSFRLEKAGQWQKKIATPINVILLSMAQMVGEEDKSEDVISMPALLISGKDVETGEEAVMAIPISSKYFRIASNEERLKDSFEDFDFAEEV